MDGIIWNDCSPLFPEQQDQIPVLAGRQAAQYVSMEFLVFLSVPTGEPNVAGFKA